MELIKRWILSSKLLLLSSLKVQDKMFFQNCLLFCKVLATQQEERGQSLGVCCVHSWLWLVYFLRLLVSPALARGLRAFSLSPSLFLRDYLYSLSCWWVSEEQGPSSEKETCRVTLWTASCLFPKLWMGPPPATPTHPRGLCPTAGQPQRDPQLSISSLDNRLANTHTTSANSSVADSEGTSFGQFSLRFLGLKSSSQRLEALSWTPAGH